MSAFDPLRTFRIERYLANMIKPDHGSAEPSRIGCLVPLVLILVPGVVLSVMWGGLPGEEWPFALFYGVLLAVPFGYLALEGTRAWTPWLVAVAMTACFWGAFIASAIIGARDQTGANIGIVLVMLASPFVVTAGAWMAVQSVRDP